MTKTTVSLAAALSLLGVPASKAETTVAPWIAGSARFGTYSMEDVNEDIRNFDALVSASFDEINNGFGFGGAAGLSLGSGVDIAARYERMLASSDVSDQTGSLEYDFAANAFYGTLEYRSLSASGPSFGIGAGAGIVSSAGDVEVSLTGLGAASGDVEGSGPLLQVFGLVDFAPRSRASVVVLGGYRYAKASSVKLDGVPIENQDGSDFDVDYSGLIVGAELRIRLSSD